MDVRGNQTEMPRAGLPRDPGRTQAIVWGVAIALAALFAIGQIVSVLAAAPAAIAYHEQVGSMPWLVSLASGLGWAGLFGVLVVLDAAILALFLWLARRYWIGFAFVPPLLYLGFGSVALWLMLADAVSAVLISA